MKTESSKPALHDSEKAVRALFLRHYRKLAKAMLNPAFHKILWDDIVQRAGVLTALEREAKRKKRTNRFLKFCRYQVQQAMDGDLRDLAKLNAQQLNGLESGLDFMIDGMLGKPIRATDPQALISLLGKLVPAGKRGPKFDPYNDAIHKRYQAGETIAGIARDLEPESFSDDPAGTLQRLSKAIKRRTPKKPKT